ncbi:MAG: hypothetical protein ACI9G1_001366 [Pirellulaceae bacterium]|jgi:hypothetical protein
MRTLTLNLSLAFTLLASMFAHAQDAPTVLRSNCMDCHNSEDKEGDIDLSPLLVPDNEDNNNEDNDSADALWTRVEKMVAARKMPPEDAEPMKDEHRSVIVDFYRSQYILRDGKPHIGVTPLRRLTRYELENTLQDLLAVKLKQPYVVSSEAAGLEPSTIEQLYPADPPGESTFDNDAQRLRQVKIPLLKLISCVDFALRKFDQDPSARENVLGISDKSEPLTPDIAKQALETFMTRAFRGHDNAAERAAIFATLQAKSKEGSAAEALLHAMKTALLSPSFIFRMETSRNSPQPYQVNSHEIATRLSYFLWSSMPDKELRQAATDGSLKTPDGLKVQIARMLNSPKRIALSENFAGQWLGFDELQSNKVYYNGENWTRGVYDELLFGFDELVKSDRSVLEIVDSDWTYLRSGVARKFAAKGHRFDETYADIFGERRSRAGLKVERFYLPPQLYKVEGDRVGGMLTAAGIMRLTSAPTRTNPIRRGVWLLENIIGERMHPPENIPPLAEAEKRVAKELANSPAEILKVHTAQASCRACHQHIDPLGLGLENFSPNGDWRTTYPSKAAIPSSGRLPNGREFTTPKQLKQELLAYYKDQIIDNIIRKMLSYAIGRELKPYDRVTIERIHKELIDNDYRIGVLIEQIVLSEQFRFRQDEI